MDARRRNMSGSVSTSYNGSGGSSGNIGGNYTIDLNNQWQKSTTVSNPDATKYDGVYESFSNYNVNSTAAIMKITIDGYSSFKFYIRSNAESSWDYVMVSQLDQTIDNNTSYSNTTLVKAHTRGNQQSGTALSNYTPVEFTNIDGGKHVITIVYRKDGSGNSGTDRGYVLIPKVAGDSGESGGDSGGPVDINNYLTIVALEDGLTASLSRNACEYCIDGDGNWLSLAAGATTQSVNAGHTLSFRGNLTPATNVGIGTFTISKKCNLEGNCMSMLFGDNAANNLSLNGKSNAFYNLFQSCTNIVSVSENFLPATTLADSCYSYMFSGCTSLTTAPELPATRLETYCYIAMFSGCTSLTTAPELPATTLASSCYSNMFRGCTSLTTAPALPATTLASSCYYYMFQGCSSLTTAPTLPATTLASNCYQYMFLGCSRLTTAPVLRATTLANYCYNGMFNKCTGLTTAPALPATTLAKSCYGSMFLGCSSLTTAPVLRATTLASNCYYAMFYGCTSLTTAPALPATTLASKCYYAMFSYCSSLATAPTLPATTLADYCYTSMFSGCSKLNYIKMLATDISAFNCLYDWVSGVASTGTFVKNPNMTSLPKGSSGIPYGWTVIDNVEFPITLEEGDNDVNGINVFGYLVNKYNGVNTRLTREYITEQITVNGSDTRYNGDVVVIMGNTYDSDGSVLSLKMATQSIINAEGDSGWMGSLYFILNSDGILSFYND